MKDSYNSCTSFPEHSQLMKVLPFHETKNCSIDSLILYEKFRCSDDTRLRPQHLVHLRTA